MANITLTIPDNMYTGMKKYSEIRWSEVARRSIAKKLADLELLEILKLTEEAETAYNNGECITESELLKELGIDENDLWKIILPSSKERVWKIR